MVAGCALQALLLKLFWLRACTALRVQVWLTCSGWMVLLIPPLNLQSHITFFILLLPLGLKLRSKRSGRKLKEHQHDSPAAERAREREPG